VIIPLRKKAAVSSVPDIVQLGELPGDGPTWLRASGGLEIGWINAGGDYLDANGVANGSTHYATTVYPPNVGPWNVTAIVEKMLADGNTGFYMSCVAVNTPGFADRTSGTPPTLEVVTTTATFNAPCIINCWALSVSGSTQGGPIIRFPAFLKFDLSGITGTLTDARLFVTLNSAPVPQNYTIHVDYLKMPALIHDPARQLGGVVQGIAAGGANDLALASHPSVLFYPSFASMAAVCASSWDWPGGGPPPPVGTNRFPIDPQIVSWPEYGLTAMRFSSQYPGFPSDGSSILSWRKNLSANTTEAYVRYMMKVDTDAYAGINELGVKLPGFESPLILGGVDFSYRMEHLDQSPSNPDAYGYFLHAYDATHPTGGGFAENRRIGNVSLEAGRIYSIEQRVKMNTKTGSAYNSDGIIQIWIDGVLCYSDTTRQIHASTNPMVIGNFFANFYHGGLGRPVAPFHYEFGGVAISTEYIGPPKKVLRVLPALPYTVPAPGMFKNISLNKMADVEPCPAHNCVYGSGGVEPMFYAWSGGAYDPDYSAYGALLIHGGGHRTYSGNEVYAFNLATALWERCRSPSLYSESEADSNGEFPDGQPYPPHTYSGVEAMPASWYGGTKGKLIRFGFSGASVTQRAHVIPLDDTPTAAWSRFTTTIPIITNLEYYAVCRDTTRQGFWLTTAGEGTDRTCFIDKNGVITSYMIGGPVASRLSLAYSPTLDLVVARGGVSSPVFDGSRIKVLQASNPAAGWIDVNFTGLGPMDVARDGVSGNESGGACGTEWSSVMGKFVSYPGRGGNKVYILKPGANPLVDPWSWTSETLTGEGGAVPTVTTATSGLNNGHWSRFREVPALKCFVWADSAGRPVQLWRPTGMV
jgi:hypothetical protein